MDRRTFLASGLSTLFPCTCSFARARAASVIQGCRKAAAGGDPLVDRIRPSSGNPLFDGICRQLHNVLASDFAMRPGFCFYNDADEPNALATPSALVPNWRDGTVLFGVELLKREVDPDRGDAFAVARVAVIVAHEFGHILQFRNGMPPEGPWQMEPHADFLAGWALARQIGRPVSAGTLPSPVSLYLHIYGNADAVQTIFAKGDTEFYNPDHHGTPEFRKKMVLAGYAAKDLDAKAALEKGRSMAGVPAPSSP